MFYVFIVSVNDDNPRLKALFSNNKLISVYYKKKSQSALLMRCKQLKYRYQRESL